MRRPRIHVPDIECQHLHRSSLCNLQLFWWIFLSFSSVLAPVNRSDYQYSTQQLRLCFKHFKQFQTHLTDHGRVFGQYIWYREGQGQLLLLLQDRGLYTRREMLQNPQQVSKTM